MQGGERAQIVPAPGRVRPRADRSRQTEIDCCFGASALGGAFHLRHEQAVRHALLEVPDHGRLSSKGLRSPMHAAVLNSTT
jgi:hypothetical protein